MDEKILCYRCGDGLERLTLPLSRRDNCPNCGVELHVCRMCIHFDRAVVRQCREDGAEDVKEKDRANFCDWYKPSSAAFDVQQKNVEDAARAALDDLFGE